MEFQVFRVILEDQGFTKEQVTEKVGSQLGAEHASALARLAKTTDEGLKCLETAKGGVGGGHKGPSPWIECLYYPRLQKRPSGNLGPPGMYN